MKNQYQVQAWMFDLICLEELTPDSAFQRIRRDDIKTFEEINQKQRGPNGVVSLLELALQKLEKEWKTAHGPAAREYMKLTNAEIRLRGDIQAALMQLPCTDPRDLRELMRVVQLIAGNETWNGTEQPPYLVEAIELLEADKVDCTAFRAELDKLYPTAKPDADDEPAEA